MTEYHLFHMITLIKFNTVSGHFGSRCESRHCVSATVIYAEEHARFAAKHPAVTGERALFCKVYKPAKLSGKAF